MVFVQYQLPVNIEAHCCLRIHIEDKRVPLSNSYRCVYCQHQYPLGSVYLAEARKSGCYKASDCFYLHAPRCVLQSVYLRPRQEGGTTCIQKSAPRSHKSCTKCVSLPRCVASLLSKLKWMCALCLVKKKEIEKKGCVTACGRCMYVYVCMYVCVMR